MARGDCSASRDPLRCVQKKVSITSACIILSRMKCGLVKFVSACLLACASLSTQAATSKPNIVWLIAEDFGPHLSCCGTEVAR